MKKKLILHIGQSKTGTSAIQDHLARNRRELLQAGYLYPRIARGGVPLDIVNHNGFADALVRPTVFPRLNCEEYFRQFREQMNSSSNHTVILSAEHFFGGLPRFWEFISPHQYREIYKLKLEKLREFSEEFDVSIVCYLRPQAAWLSSGLNQSIKIARLINSADNIYVSDRHFYEREKENFKYSDRLKMWRDVIKPSHILAVPYNRSALIGNDSVTDFERRADIAGLKLPIRAKRDINQSLSIEYLEVKKILNDSPKSKPKERTVIKALGDLSRRSQLSTKYMVEPDVIEDLSNYVDEDNYEISQTFMGSDHSLETLSGYDGARLRRPSTEEVLAAMDTFNRYMHRPEMILYLSAAHAKSAIRKRAPTLHSALNLTKRTLGTSWGSTWNKK